jgi:hypothetical protein
MTGRDFKAWLSRRGWDKARAGREFGVHKRTVYRWLATTTLPKVVELACRGIEAQKAVIHSANLPQHRAATGIEN